MKKGKEDAFIASSKVIIFKLGHNVAAVLGTLMYKKKYWKEQNGLIKFKGHDCFYLSYLDIELDSFLKKGVISSAINTLATNGLIKVFRQGLGKPNCYYVDESVILAYKKKHYEAYKAWRVKKRANNKAVTPVVVKKAEIDTSGSANSEDLEVLNEDTTNNKNTKNKNTKKNTNYASAEEDVFSGYEEELTALLESVNEHDDLERAEGIKAISEYLLKLVPGFKGFTISNKDQELINEIIDYKLYPFHIAQKIISNAQSIKAGVKECRFGNLFVGLQEINEGMEMKYN